jgi:hypothetical protein
VRTESAEGHRKKSEERSETKRQRASHGFTRKTKCGVENLIRAS